MDREKDKHKERDGHRDKGKSSAIFNIYTTILLIFVGHSAASLNLPAKITYGTPENRCGIGNLPATREREREKRL